MAHGGITITPYERNTGFGKERRQPYDKAVYRNIIEEIDEPDEDGHDRQLQLKRRFTPPFLSMEGRTKLSSVHCVGSTWAAFSILRRTAVASS